MPRSYDLAIKLPSLEQPCKQPYSKSAMLQSIAQSTNLNETKVNQTKGFIGHLLIGQKTSSQSLSEFEKCMQVGRSGKWCKAITESQFTPAIYGQQVCNLWKKLVCRVNWVRQLLVYVNIIQVPGSVQFSCSVVSDSLQPHESQHARPPCPSPTPRVHSDSRPLSQ